MIKYAYDFFFLQPACKQIFLLSVTFNCIIKYTVNYLHSKKIPRMINFVYKPFFCWPLLKLIEFIYNFSLFQLSQKLLFVSNLSSDYIIKFTANYLHYKKIPEMTESIYKPFFCRSPLKLTEFAYNSFLFQLL